MEPAYVQQRATKAEVSKGYSVCVNLSSGDQARCGCVPVARNRARRFQINQASQPPCGFASQASAIALVATPKATIIASVSGNVNGDRAAAGVLAARSRLLQ